MRIRVRGDTIFYDFSEKYFGRKPIRDERYGDIVAPVEIAAKFCIYSSA